MDMFPYPSGAGLHVGHPLGYIATDVIGRYRRMQGDNVLHALGYDAFGLPAEIHAVQTGEHPRTNTVANMANMRRQLRRLGLAHDPRRSFATIDPDFMRWTQWIFVQIFESWYDVDAKRARPISELVAAYESGERRVAGGGWAELAPLERRQLIDSQRLAYIDESPVNWCPALGTVLSNEEVTPEGRSERGNFPVFPRNLRQWKMRITAYADRLIDDLDRMDWPESVKHMQRNWIGRSHGAEVSFAVDGLDAPIDVFTTRPDTLFGATYVVLAPEHELVGALTAADVARPESTPPGPAEQRRRPTRSPTTALPRAPRVMSSARRTATRRASSPAHMRSTPSTATSIPVFIADYVLTGYGTGAIMAVPGQDARDHEFAEKFNLPIIRTVQPTEGFDGDAFLGDGPAINSSNADIDLNGLGIDEAKSAIIGVAREAGRLGAAPRHTGSATGCSAVSATGASRSRSCSTRTAHRSRCPTRCCRSSCPRCPTTSPRRSSPTTSTSEPEPPLARVPDWVNVELDLGDGLKKYRRETNTMPNWAGSSWYELRYADPHNAETPRRPGERGLLAWSSQCRRDRRRRPVRRRRRARRAAPAVCALLAQGALRPRTSVERRTVPEAVQPGLHPGLRLHRFPRCLRAGRRGRRARRWRRVDLHVRRQARQSRVREDGQEPQECRHSRRDVRRVRRRHVPGLRDVDGPPRRVPAVGDPCCGGCATLPAARVASARRRRHRRVTGHRRCLGRRDAARPAPDDRGCAGRHGRACVSTPPSPS